MRSGYNGVARGMRSESDTTPILLLTARTGTDNLVDGLDAGADDYLTKPFDIRELRARLRALTRRGLGTASTVIKHGPLTFDAMGEVRFEYDAALIGQIGTLNRFLKRAR